MLTAITIVKKYRPISMNRYRFLTMTQLESQGIIGDVVDAVEHKASIDVHYGKLSIHQGGTYSPESCIDAPAIKLIGTDPSQLYTLLMTDPDAPDPASPTNREWLHWMVTNIRGDDDVHKGSEVIPYMGPSPPIGVHRYVFLLFQQASPDDKLSVNMSEIQGRKKFNTRAFSKQHGLSGNPVAATFFLSHKMRK